MILNGYRPMPTGTTAGWKKAKYPLFEPALNTMFDSYVIKEDGIYKMWFSWRPTKSIMYTTSTDGIHWEPFCCVLTRQLDSSWEADKVSRPTLVKKDNRYHMWYTGHMIWSGPLSAAIGYAVSDDGIHWERPLAHPVLRPDKPWENHIIWTPHVIYDEEEDLFKMWYAGGATEGTESDALGYATSKDGIHWTKYPLNPIFVPDGSIPWEMAKVSAPFVWKRDGWYYMSYLGNDADMRGSNGLARSRDGITNWERHPSNPIIASSEGCWDHNCICKLMIIETETGYMGWYNGGNRRIEEIGIVYHEGFDLGFETDGKPAPNEREDYSYLCPINITH